MADRSSKFTKALPTAIITVAAVVTIFLGHCIINFAIPTRLLADNVPQFSSTIFVAFRTRFGVPAITITEYHRQEDGQVERLYWTIVCWLRQYVTEKPKAGDAPVLSSAYTYNVQIHKASKLSPFCLLLTRNLPEADRIRIKTMSCIFNSISVLSQLFPTSGESHAWKSGRIEISIEHGKTTKRITKARTFRARVWARRVRAHQTITSALPYLLSLSQRGDT